MIIIYTKQEIMEIMREHYESSHYGKDSKRPIDILIFGDDQLTIEMGLIPDKCPSND